MLQKSLISVILLLSSAAAQWTMTSGAFIPPPPPPPGSEPWRGILDYSRAADWSHVGVQGGIPTYTIDCATVAPTGLKAWEKEHAYSVGDAISDSRGAKQVVSVAGTSGAIEPPLSGTSPLPWQYSDGVTTPDGTVTWRMEAWTSAGAGQTDTANVTNAIADCDGRRGIVHLVAGHYYFTRGIVFNKGHRYPQITTSPLFNSPISYVLLKGTGPMQTYLHFPRVGPCGSGDICVQAATAGFSGFAPGGSENNPYPGSGAAWLGDGSSLGSYAKGDTTLIVGPWKSGASGANHTSEPDIGDILFLDQNNDAINICPLTPPATPYNCTVPGATEVGSIATIVTTVPHGYRVGQCVGIGDMPDRNLNLWVGYNSGMNPNKTALCGYPFPGPPFLPVWWQITAVGCIVDKNFVNQSQCGDHPIVAFQYDAGASNLNPVRISRVEVNANVLTVAATNQVLAVGDQATLSGLTGAAAVLNGQTVTVTATTTTPAPATFSANVATATLASTITTGRADAIPPKPAGGGQATTDTEGAWLSSVGGATMTAGSLSDQSSRRCDNPQPLNVSNPACLPGEISIRSQFEAKTITAKVAGGQGTCPAPTGGWCYTIDPPLYMNNWRSSQRPGAWWTGKKNAYDGLEGFTYLAEHDPGDGTKFAIKFLNATNGWVRNVRGIDINRSFVAVILSSRITSVDNYVGGTKGGASTAYVFEDNAAADTLMMNNICQHTVSCLMTSTVMGRVAGYNFMVDAGYSLAMGSLMPLMTMNHLAGFYNLFEGNDSAGIQTDNQHGTGGVSTAFRSRSRAQDLPNKATNRNGLSSVSNNRGLNFVGMLMGWSGLTNRYLDDNPANSAGGTDNTIFRFGLWKTNNGATGQDPLASKTSVRWGNYDAATQTTRWCGTGSEADCSCGATAVGTYCRLENETAVQGTTFLAANAVPANHDLPPSFFLTGPPTFWTTTWGTPGWPPMGPDVDATGSPLDTTCPGGIITNGGQSSTGTGPGSFTRCDGIGHHAYQIPAQICYNNLPLDTQWQHPLTGANVGAGFTVTHATWASTGCSLGRPCVTLTVDNDLDPNKAFTYSMEVTGIDPPGYNGTFQVEAITPTTLTYWLATNPGTPYTGGGMVTTPNYKQFDARWCYPNEPLN